MKKPVLFLTVVSLSFVVWLFVTGGPGISDRKASSVPATYQDAAVQAQQPSKALTANQPVDTAKQTSSALRSHPLRPQQQLSPEIKQAVNRLLRPPGQTYEPVQTAQGMQIDLGGRQASVSVATINSKGELVVKDYTSPVE